MHDEIANAETIQSLPHTGDAWLLDALEGWKQLADLTRVAREKNAQNAIRAVAEVAEALDDGELGAGRVAGSAMAVNLAASPEGANFDRVERIYAAQSRFADLQRMPSMLQAVRDPAGFAAWLGRVWEALDDDRLDHRVPGVDLLTHLLDDVPPDLIATGPVVFDLGPIGAPSPYSNAPRFPDALDVGCAVDIGSTVDAGGTHRTDDVFLAASLSSVEVALLHRLADAPRVRAELLRGAVLAGGAIRDVLADGVRAVPADLDFVIAGDAWEAFENGHPELARSTGLRQGHGFRVAKEADDTHGAPPISWIVTNSGVTRPSFISAFEAEPNRLALYAVTPRWAAAVAGAGPVRPQLRLAAWPGALEAARARAYRPHLGGVLRGGGGPLRALVRQVKMAARGWVVDPAWATVLAYLVAEALREYVPRTTARTVRLGDDD